MNNAKHAGIVRHAEARRVRTIALVESSIKHMSENGMSVSIANLVSTSKLLDSEGKGISASVLHRNPTARACYLANRSWSSPKGRNSRRRDWKVELKFIRSVRDQNAKRRRLLRYKRGELVEILIAVGNLYAELEKEVMSRSKDFYDSL